LSKSPFRCGFAHLVLALAVALPAASVQAAVCHPALPASAAAGLADFHCARQPVPFAGKRLTAACMAVTLADMQETDVRNMASRPASEAAPAAVADGWNATVFWLPGLAAAAAALAGWWARGYQKKEARRQDGGVRRAAEQGDLVSGSVSTGTPDHNGSAGSGQCWPSAPAPDSHGTVAVVADIARDVPAARRDREALKPAMPTADGAAGVEGENAELAVKSRWVVLAAIGHALREPAQSASLFADSMAPFIASGPGEVIFANLRGALESLDEVLDRLLDHTRLGSGAVIPSVSEFPLRELFANLSDSLAPAAQKKGLSLAFVAGGEVVRSDRVLLGKILLHMAGNAIKFTQQGHVRVACRVTGGTSVIEVSDSGPGIEEDRLPGIWDEFVHSRGEEGTPVGVGLGLSIVRSLSGILGHRVSAISGQGQGSVFSIEVPVVATALPEVSHPHADAKPPVLAPDTVSGLPPPQGDGAPLILVVDDTPSVREGLTGILEMLGYIVVAAENTGEALHGIGLQRRMPDAIIADYKLLHGAVGTDTIRSVRGTAGVEIPAVVLTGEVGPEVQEDADSIGVRVLYKPINAMVLSATIKRLIAGGHA